MFSVFLSVHRGLPPGQGPSQGPRGPPWSRSGGGLGQGLGGLWSRSESRFGGGLPGQGPGQGWGATPSQIKVWVKVQGPPQGPGQGQGAPRSRSGSRSQPPLSKSKNAGSAGGTPLAVTQEDCLVQNNIQPNFSCGMNFIMLEQTFCHKGVANKDPLQIEREEAVKLTKKFNNLNPPPSNRNTPTGARSVNERAYPPTVYGVGSPEGSERHPSQWRGTTPVQSATLSEDSISLDMLYFYIWVIRVFWNRMYEGGKSQIRCPVEAT